jgi:hypothetical protein
MARKKKSKSNWLKILLLFLLVPAAVWFAAFLLWFYWYDLNAWVKPENAGRAQPSVARQRAQEERREPGAAKRTQERILDEDRKKLEDILRRHN